MQERGNGRSLLQQQCGPPDLVPRALPESLLTAHTTKSAANLAAFAVSCTRFQDGAMKRSVQIDWPDCRMTGTEHETAHNRHKGVYASDITILHRMLTHT